MIPFCLVFYKFLVSNYSKSVAVVPFSYFCKYLKSIFEYFFIFYWEIIEGILIKLFKYTLLLLFLHNLL